MKVEQYQNKKMCFIRYLIVVVIYSPSIVIKITFGNMQIRDTMRCVFCSSAVNSSETDGVYESSSPSGTRYP